ncbi:hypothetical protein BpHYR1_005338, partial [Brachionus plicatilis]
AEDQLSKRLYEQINHEYQSNSFNFSIITPEPNLPVSAQYQDKNWCRAEINDGQPVPNQIFWNRFFFEPIFSEIDFINKF